MKFLKECSNRIKNNQEVRIHRIQEKGKWKKKKGNQRAAFKDDTQFVLKATHLKKVGVAFLAEKNRICELRM